ncbi:MAG: hypothetical protein HC930_03960 [Hydrococcus sp. SU_1_0]|nr:hypothetical protein [Hydrococcus sp. SU_1_0]
MDTSKNTSKNNFNNNQSITEDWQGGYRLELDLTAEAKAEDWQLDFSLPYKIKAAYGVDLMDNGDGNYSIKGQNDQVNLESGQSIKPVFIIEDGGKEALELKITGNSVMGEIAPMMPAETPVEETPMMPGETEAEGKISVTPSIVEDWNGGYKLELDLKAESAANNWKLDFDLPYEIKAAYGVDLMDNGDGHYSIQGQNDQVNLTSGQSINPILVIDDGGKEAVNQNLVCQTL